MGVISSRIMTQHLIIIELYISHLGLLLTKYHRWGRLNNRHIFLTVQEAGKSKIKLPADSVLYNKLLPGFQTANLLFFHGREREREFWSLFFFYRDTNSIKGTPTSWLHLNLTSPQSPYFHISSHWWLGLQNVIMERHNQSIRNHRVKRTLKTITEKCITVYLSRL